MLVINKQTMYEAVCRAQSEEVHPEDYGFENNEILPFILDELDELDELESEN